MSRVVMKYRHVFGLYGVGGMFVDAAMLMLVPKSEYLLKYVFFASDLKVGTMSRFISFIFLDYYNEIIYISVHLNEIYNFCSMKYFVLAKINFF